MKMYELSFHTVCYWHRSTILAYLRSYCRDLSKLFWEDCQDFRCRWWWLSCRFWHWMMSKSMLCQMNCTQLYWINSMALDQWLCCSSMSMVAQYPIYDVCEKIRKKMREKYIDVFSCVDFSWKISVLPYFSLVLALTSSLDDTDLFEHLLADCGNDFSDPVVDNKWFCIIVCTEEVDGVTEALSSIFEIRSVVVRVVAAESLSDRCTLRCRSRNTCDCLRANRWDGRRSNWTVRRALLWTVVWNSVLPE